MSRDAPSVALSQVAREWARIGLTGFGGPPAHLALLRGLTVEDRGWLTARTFEDANAACGMLPGPASTQMAIFCADRVAGPAGAIVGGLAFIVPAVVAVTLLSIVFLGGSPPALILGAGAGAGAAVPAVAVAAARMLLVPAWRRIRALPAGAHDAPLPWLWALYGLAGAAAAGFAGADLVLVLVGCGAVELVRRRAARSLTASVGSFAGWPAAGLLLAVVGTGAGAALAWTAIKVGALAFGGGFVIVPLMQADAVHVHHWMTQAQFLNAVALGQVTPGPVIATVAAVGYSAAGVGGAAMAAAIAFAPSFLFVLTIGRHVERLGASVGPRAFLDGAAPAAMGAIAGSAVTLALALAHPWQFVVLTGALVALLLDRRGVVSVLVGAGLIGALIAATGGPPG